MGIKFHCPNGHKLNVKAFLAGKKGVCPKCGTKVRIPLASEAGLVDSDVEEGDAGQGGSVMINTATSTAAHALAAGGTGSSATAVAAPPAPVAPTLPPAMHDPIAEAPTAIWYVRPPSGGQYGPARGDVMRTWLMEGRVSSDSFVWRDGWTDWRIAGQLFPDLQGPISAAPVVPTVIHANSVSRHQAKPRGTGGLAVAILVGLGLLIFVLLGALAYILFAFR